MGIDQKCKWVHFTLSLGTYERLRGYISEINYYNCNIRSNVTTLRIVRWLLGYVAFVIPVHTACIKLVIRNLSSYYIGDEVNWRKWGQMRSRDARRQEEVIDESRRE